MGGNRKKLRGREKSAVALMLALFITANMIAGDLSSVLVQGAPGDASVTGITLAEGLDADQIVFCPGNDYGFQCSLENAGGSDDIEWTVSAEGQTDTAGISITEDGEDQTKAVLHIGEEVKPGTQFTVAASIAETEGSEAKYDEITIADFGSLSVQDIAIWSDPAGADAQELTVTALEDVNWVNAETAVVKLRSTDSVYDQYSLNTGQWTELTGDGISISGIKQQIRFRNSASTQISETVVLNFDGIGPTVTVTAEPSEEGWTNQQKYTVTADDNEGGSGVKQIYYYDISDPEGTLDSVPDNGEISFSKVEDAGKTLVFYAVDNLDNKGENSAQYTVNDIDTTPPGVTTVGLPKDVTENDNWISSIMVSDENKEGINVNIQVSDEENGSGIKSVKYQICEGSSEPDDEKWEDEGLASDGQGNYTVDIKEKVKALVDGNYKIYVRAQDNAGNISKNVSADFKVDKTAPDVSKMSETVINNGDWISAAMTSDDNKEGIDVNIPVSDGANSSGIKSVEYQICEGSSEPDDEKWEDEGLTSDGQGNYTVDIKEKVKALVDGNYKIYVRAQDNAGNISKNVSADFKVDKTAPKCGEPVYDNATRVGEDYYFNAASKDENNGTVSFTVSDLSGIKAAEYKVGESVETKNANFETDAETGKVTVTVPIIAEDYSNDGIIAYTLIITDSAGNQVEETFDVRWDTIAPSDISVYVSDEEAAREKDDPIWKWLEDQWDSLIKFIAGQETVYINVFAIDNGTGVGSVTCKYLAGDREETVELKDSVAGISKNNSDGITENTVYHFSEKVTIKKGVEAEIISVVAKDQAGNEIKIQSPEEGKPTFKVDDTAPVLDVSIEKGPVYTDDEDVAYYNGAALTDDNKLEVKLTLTEDHFLKDNQRKYEASDSNTNHYGNAYEKFTVTQYERGLNDWNKITSSNPGLNETSITWDRESDNSNKYTVTLELDPGYKYEISYEMNDGADNALTGGEVACGSVNDGKYTYTLAVDNTNPQGNVQVEGDWENKIEAQDAIKYYYGDGQLPDSITAQIQEDMFFSDDAIFKKEFAEPGGTYGEPEDLSGKWNVMTIENMYSFSVDPSPFSADGNYKFTLDYTDRAQNEMMRSNDVDNDWNNKDTNKDQIIVIDQTAPEISLEYSQEGKTYTYETDPETGETRDITYFNNNTTLTVKVKENNFDPSKVVVEALLSDQPSESATTGDNNESVKESVELQVVTDWKEETDEEGATWYVASYESLSDEARYDVTVNVTDLAGNPAEEVSDTFVIDKTAPKITAVNLTSGKETLKKSEIKGRQYFKEEVTLTIEVEDHNFRNDSITEQTQPTVVVGGNPDGITFTSKNIYGDDIYLNEDGSEKSETTLKNFLNEKENWTQNPPEGDTYRLEYTFNINSNYTLADLQLQDLAGNNSNNSTDKNRVTFESPLEFTYDSEAPDISYVISCDRSILNYLTFGYFGKKCVTITATVKDEISGVYGFTFESVEVEGVDIKRQGASQNDITRDTQLTEKPVGKDTFSWSTPVDAEFNPVDFRGYVSGVAEDYSGNGLDEEEKADIEKGIIVETEDTHERDSSLSLTYDREPNAYGFYNDDVEVTVLAEDSYSGIYSVAYTARTSETAEPEYEENENFWEQKNAEIATIYKKTFELDKDTYYSNDVHVYAETEDNVGYINTVEDVLKIDSKKPEISVTYNNLSPVNGNYYNQTRIATVTIDERNFDANRTQLVWTSTGAAPTVSGWTHNGERHTAYVTFSADADYTFTVRSTDLADNVADYSRVDIFTVDQTDPVIQVTYDNNDARNGNYYNAQRTATIQITEHNFNAADVQITGTATENGAGVTFPSASGWSASGDVHTATITYSQDAHYTFDIAYTDMAGNAAADYQEDQFAVDQTAPELVIRGVQDESANNADQIGFVITASDNNFDTMTPRLTASVRDENNNFSTVEIPLENEQISGTSHSYTVENLEDDGIYSLTCTVVDMAGNTCERVTLQDNDGNTYAEMSYPGTEEALLEFSVNRDGSAYRIIVNPEGINNGITNAEADDISVRIEEINVDELEEGSTRLDLYNGIAAKQIQLVPGVNYETGEAEGSGGWRMYTYTLDGENFVDDGNYQVGVYSVDKAGNESDSALDEKAKISFIVDRTAPELSMNVKSRTSYDTVEKVVELNITELHLDKSGVAVEVNGEPQDIQETAAGQYEFTLKSGMNQSVSVVCTDQAGNKTELSEERITVSTNIMVRAGAWIVNNLMVFLAIVFVLLLLIILIIVWRVNARRKRRIETEDE